MAAKTRSAAEQEEPILAQDLMKQFQNDYDGAHQHYLDKWICVKGVVRYAGPDPYGLPSLELSDRADGPTDCLCVFQSSVDGYNVGDVVTVSAHYVGCAPTYGPVLKKAEAVR